MGEYGTTNRDYIWLENTPVAMVDTAGTASTVSYVHADGLNTPRVVTDASGTTFWQWGVRGNPFGEQSPTEPAGHTFNLRFPGQYFDVEAGRSNWDYRTYDATIGRSLQSDPIGFGPARLHVCCDKPQVWLMSGASGTSWIAFCLRSMVSPSWCGSLGEATHGTVSAR